MLGNVVPTIPTTGFNVETVEHKDVNFSVWDVGGEKTIRPLWCDFYKKAQGLIFVVDATDRARLLEAYEEFSRMRAD